MSRAQLWASIVTIAVCASACSESPAEPENASLVRRSAAVMATDGYLQLSLDLNGGILSDQFGNELTVTASEAATLASSFDALQEVDNNLSGLAGALPEPPACGWGGPCDELRDWGTASPHGSAGRPSIPAIQIRRGLVGVQSMGYTRRPPARKVRRASRDELIPVSDVANSFGWPPTSCIDISTSIWALRDAYDATKAEYFDLFETIGYGIAGGLAQEGSPPTLGMLTGITVRLDVLTSSLLSQRAALRFLAGLYGTQGCWSGSWDDNSAYINPGGGYSGPGYYQRSCDMETIWISEDNGVSWQGIWVEVCEVEWVPNEE